MSITKYFDYRGKVLGEDELSNCPDYHKAEINSKGLFELIETFEKNELVHVNPFIELEKDAEPYLEKYPKLEYIEFCLHVKNKGNYAQYHNFTINKHKLKSDVGIQVYDHGMLPIFVNNRVHSEPKNKYLFKYFYYSEINVEFEFEYEPSGAFKRLSVYDVNMIVDSNQHSIDPDMVGIGKNDYDFNWEGMEYYKNAEPILPDNDITTHNNAYC